MIAALTSLAVAIACAVLAAVCVRVALSVDAEPDDTSRPTAVVYRGAAVVCAVCAVTALRLAVRW